MPVGGPPVLQGADGLQPGSCPPEMPPAPPPAGPPPGPPLEALPLATAAAPDRRLRVAELCTSAAAELRALGNARLADFLVQQGDMQVRELRKEDPARVAALQAATAARKRKIAEAREEDREHRARMEARKLELKLATEARLRAAEEAKLGKAGAKEKQIAAKAAEVEARAKKEAEKAAALARSKFAEEQRRKFAGGLLERKKQFFKKRPHAKADLRAFLKTFKDKVPWKKVAKLPEFWNPADKSGLRCISLKDMFGKYVDEAPVYASERFAWELWGHAKPSGPSQQRLERCIEDVMPGYTATLGCRFSARDLLKETKGNADVAFLRAGWYYASLVPFDMYPCGFREWKGHASGAASSAASAGGAASSS